MSTVEEALVSIAQAEVGLTGLIGSSPMRLHPSKLPENVTLPAATYQRISGIRESAMGSDTGVARARIQLSAYDRQYSGANAVKEELRMAFQRYRGTVLGVEIMDIFLENDMDLYEDDVDMHHLVVDLEVIYREST